MPNAESESQKRFSPTDLVDFIDKTDPKSLEFKQDYFDPAQADNLSVNEVDKLVKQGLEDGVFVRDQTDTPTRDHDFTFGNKIKGVTSEVDTGVLDLLRERKSQAIKNDFKEDFAKNFSSDTPQADKVNALVNSLRVLVADEVIDAVNVPIKETVPNSSSRTQGQASGNRGQTTRERSVDKPRITYDDGPSKAIVDAITEIKVELNLTPEQIRMFDAEVLALSREKTALHEKRKEQGRYASQQDRLQRDADARLAREKLRLLEDENHVSDIDEAHTQALKHDGSTAAQSKVYRKYETLIHNERDETRKSQIREIRDDEMVQARERYQEEHPPITLQDIKRAEEDRLYKSHAKDGYADNLAASEKLDNEKSLQRDRDIANISFRDGIKYNDMDVAHTLALNVDRENAEVSKAYIKFSRPLDRLDAEIKATTDNSYRLALEQQRPLYLAERERLLEAEVKHQRSITVQAATGLSNVVMSSRESEPNMKRVGPENKDFKDIAAATRAALKTESIPMLETKKGGFFKTRIAEMYLAVPGNDHLVVVERRKNRTGDLISQTVIATEKSVRGRGDHFLPPREVRHQLPDIRKHDEKSLKAYVQFNRIGTHVEDTPGRLKEGRLKLYFRELTTDAITGSNGVYVKEYGAAPHEASARKYSRGTGRRGGFRFWASRGRI